MRQQGRRATAGLPYAASARRGGVRGELRHLLGLVWVMHLPRGALSAVVVWVFSAVAAEAARQPLHVWTLARLLLGVLCMRAAIAGVNDYSNRYLDAASGRDGPLVRRLIQPWEALLVPIVATAVMLALVGSLGALPLLLACALLVLALLGLLYFKGSPISAALCAVSVPCVPLLAWSVFGRWQPFLLWLLPLGAAAGVGLHIAGTLPGVEREAAIGLRGLPYRLGLRRSAWIAAGTVPALAGAVWALRLTSAVPADGRDLALATAIALVAAGPAAALYLLRRGAGWLRASYILETVGVVCLAAGWLMAASR